MLLYLLLVAALGALTSVAASTALNKPVSATKIFVSVLFSIAAGAVLYATVVGV